jgi:hypothetical protein
MLDHTSSKYHKKIKIKIHAYEKYTFTIMLVHQRNNTGQI